MASKCEVAINNVFNQTDWKKIILKDFVKFRDVLVKTQPSVVDLVGSVNKRANETQFVRMRCKTKVISQKAREGFLTVNTRDRKMSVIVDQNI